MLYGSRRHLDLMSAAGLAVYNCDAAGERNEDWEPAGKTMMKVLAIRVIAAMTVVLFGVGSLCAQVEVHTEAGLVAGTNDADGKVVIFKGIPFAAPPVGELRWREPQPVARWEGVRKATEFGARCMQARIYEDMVFRDAGASEDCLDLHVW